MSGNAGLSSICLVAACDGLNENPARSDCGQVASKNLESDNPDSLALSMP